MVEAETCFKRRAGLMTEHQAEPTEAKVQNQPSLLIMRSVSLHLYLLLMLNPAPGKAGSLDGRIFIFICRFALPL